MAFTVSTMQARTVSKLRMNTLFGKVQNDTV